MVRGLPEVEHAD
jgi:hypothetical protein